MGYGQTYEVIDRNAGSPTYGQRSRYEVRDNSQLGSFDYGHQILTTGAHVPSAFRKTLKFANGTKKCFYFPNSHTNGKDWTEFEISCN